MGVVSFTLVFVLSFVLIFIWDPSSESLEVGANVLILIAFFIITLVITTEYTFFYIYIT